MPVTILCPHCTASYSVAERNLGRVGRCKRCGNQFPLASGVHAVGPISEPLPVRSPVQNADEAIPPSIGRFRIIRKLGQGGMGTVYLAHDPQLGRPVALKVPHPEQARQPSDRERFLREARAAAQFHHPNFCPIFDIGDPDGLPFLVMAYIEGQTLAHSILPGQPREPRKAAEDVRQLALALAEAHRAGIVHRDLKPANVMVDARGNLILMDFGLARRVDGSDARLTVSGSILGTPAYMSPEQARADLEMIGPRSDIYSLGVILYEMLAGHRPFQGPAMMVVAQILMVDPESPSAHHPAVDPGLELICLNAMAKKIGDRFASMDALADALGKWLESATKLGPPDSPISLADEIRGWIEAPREVAPPDSTWSPSRSKSPHRQTRLPLVFAIAGCIAFTLILVIVSFKNRPRAEQSVTPAAQTAPATPQAKPVPSATSSPPSNSDLITDSIGIQLKLIPAGEFLMGSDASDPEADEDEKAHGGKHQVRITRPFYLGTTEVTVGQFRRFVEATGHRTVVGQDGKDTWLSPGFRQGDDHPVVNVSWNDAVAFCEWLGRQEGQTYRLPTEAEWEYSCRAGGSMRYWFGDAAEGLATAGNVVTAKDGFEHTAPVGRFRANPFGLFDMHGNVWEWCSDGYEGYYAQSQLPVADPPGPSQSATRVIRGGGWFGDPRGARSACRVRYAPVYRLNGLGFRVARVRPGQ